MKLQKINIINDLVVSKKIVNFLNPEYVCVLLKSFDEIDGTKYVNKSKLFEKDNLLSYSSVSGEISGLVDILVNNKSRKALFIKNDFREKDTKFISKKVSDKDSFLKLIKDTVFYKKFYNKNIKNIIVNSIVDEPYVINEEYVLKNLGDKIIDLVSFLSEIFSCDKTSIVFKNTDNDNISEYLSKTGSYTHMNIVALEDLYLLEKEDFLLNKLNVKKEECVVLKPSEILELRHFLKTNSYMCEKYINVVDMVNKKSKMVFVKKNIIVSELLNKLNLLSLDYDYYKNGGVSGFLINENKEIITDDFNSLFVVKKEKKKSSECINCGKCVSSCPAGVNPIKCYNSKIKDYRCIGCGLCSLICPSNIDLKKVGKK